MKKLLSTTALIVALAVSGASFAQDKGPGHEGHPMFDGALSKLPQADADKFRATMKQAHEQQKPTMEKIHALHKELHAILVAENFDKAAFLKKSEKLQSLMASSHSAMTKAFADAVSQLPQDERTTLADALHKPHEGQWNGQKHPHEHAPEHGDDAAPGNE